MPLLCGERRVMKDTFYLIINERGAKKIRSTRPQLSSDEVAIKINIALSDNFFERFVPETTITIPDDKVIQPEIKVDIG